LMFSVHRLQVAEKRSHKIDLHGEKRGVFQKKT